MLFILFTPTQRWKSSKLCNFFQKPYFTEILLVQQHPFLLKTIWTFRSTLMRCYMRSESVSAKHERHSLWIVSAETKTSKKVFVMDGKGDFRTLRIGFCFIHPFDEEDNPNDTMKNTWPLSVASHKFICNSMESLALPLFIHRQHNIPKHYT